jgi:GGDEF domain-containing protein
VAARLGGDEFALLWRHPPADPLAAGRAVLDQLTQPASVAGHRLTPQASLGLAAASPTLTGRGLLAAADTAMYQAKHGPTRIRVYDHNLPPPPVDRPARRRRDHPTR